MRVLFSQLGSSWLIVCFNWGVETKVIGGQALITIIDHLTPQVRVLSAFVHSGIRLEVMLNEQLVLFKHNFSLLVGCIFEIINFIEVSSNSVLLIMETIKVNLLDGVNMIFQQFAEHTPKFKKLVINL